MSYLEKLRFWAIETASDLDELAENLAAFLSDPCYIMEEHGKEFIVEGRQQFESVGSLKIELYSKEHAPPHFHVTGKNVNASFVIESCELLNGTISAKDRKKIEYWHKRAKPRLVLFWNAKRPSDCPVGPIVT